MDRLQEDHHDRNDWDDEKEWRDAGPAGCRSETGVGRVLQPLPVLRRTIPAGSCIPPETADAVRRRIPTTSVVPQIYRLLFSLCVPQTDETRGLRPVIKTMQRNRFFSLLYFLFSGCSYLVWKTSSPKKRISFNSSTKLCCSNVKMPVVIEGMHRIYVCKWHNKNRIHIRA